MVLTSPGATLTGSSSLARGNGAAAASVVAGSIILNGVTESDLEKSDFESTRHGHTLSGIFRARLMVLPPSEEEEESGGNMCTLVLVVPTEVEDVDKVIGDVNDIFESAKLGLGLDVTFEDLYDVKIEVVQNDADAVKVMSMASAAATAHTLPPKLSIPSTVIKTYTKMSSTSEPSPSVASAILACDESMTRNHKTARAKLTAWRSRTQRGLTVDHFGSAALQLRSRAMEQYDRDTILAAGLTGSIAAPYRLETRIRLAGRIEGIVRELFLVQVGLLEDSTLKRFEAVLLRKYSGRGPKGGGGIDDATVHTVYDDNAAMVRTAVFAFDTAMDDLVLPSLSLTKAKAVREMTAKLESALAVFPDSAAARLKSLREVAKAANKQHAPEVKAAPPSDRSMNVGLDLVAMVRPDGFGSLQGFVGYQLGGNNMIVGIHNDADSPDVIGQFGGTRPPFLRIQPKLKIDVEL